MFLLFLYIFIFILVIERLCLYFFRRVGVFELRFGLGSRSDVFGGISLVL